MGGRRGSLRNVIIGKATATHVGRANVTFPKRQIMSDFASNIQGKWEQLRSHGLELYYLHVRKI